MNITLGRKLGFKKIQKALYCVKRINVTESILLQTQYDEIIDVRSEFEFLEDHIPGASNFPVLKTPEWQVVGTLDRVDKFESKKKGAIFVARNIADHLETHFARYPCLSFFHTIFSR